MIARAVDEQCFGDQLNRQTMTQSACFQGEPKVSLQEVVEMTMGRYKALIGPRLRARGFAAQQTEADIGVAVLNRMLATGRPDSVRCLRVIA